MINFTLQIRAGPLPLPGALNHWGRYLPPGSYHLHTVCQGCKPGPHLYISVYLLWVGIGACMLVCMWYTELTCIPYWASSTDIVGQVLGPIMCWQMAGPLPLPGRPLTTGVDIYPRVLPSTYYVHMAGPLPLPGTLNHWGRILHQGPTMKKKACVKNWTNEILDFLPLAKSLDHKI